MTFPTQVNELVVAMVEMGKTFIKDSRYLFALDMKDDTSEDVVSSVRAIVNRCGL